MQHRFFTKEFASTTAAVGEALTEALHCLHERGWCTDEDNFCVRLCIEEALVNAVVHGNRGEPDKRVHIELFEEGDCCRIRVRDEGDGFDPESVSMPGFDEMGGRGVCLIKHYMDHVHFNCDDHCLEMVFRRGSFSCASEETSKDVSESSSPIEL